MLKHSLLRVVRNHRFALWVLLILLTATILLFPLHLHYEYHVIESAYVFGDKLPLFGTIYYIWLAILLLLLFSSSRSDEWQRLALVCVFALVFFGIWIINTPNGDHPDVLWQLGHIKYLQKTGKIPLAHPNLGYFQFPGFHLTGLSLSQISGLGIFETKTLFLLFNGVLLAAILYLLSVKALKNSYLASLAVLLIIQGAPQVAQRQTFWPGNLSFIFLIILLILLTKDKDRGLETETLVSALITIILLAAFTITYLPTPTFFLFILAGIYVLQKVAKKSIVHSLTIALFLTMFLAWQMYWLRISESFAGLITNFASGLMNPEERLLLSLQPGEAYLGGVTPLWASLTRILWLVLIFGFGGIIGIWNLIKVRKLNSIEVLETGGLLGVSVFGIICALTFTWETQWLRFVWLAPLFTVPIILRFLSDFSSHNGLTCENTLHKNRGFDSKRFRRRVINFGSWFRRHVFILLIILSFVLSLPTFLSHSSIFYTSAVYSYERKAGEFLESAYGAGELDFFSTETTKIKYSGYLPEALFHFSPAPQLATNREELWQKMNHLVDDFGSRKRNAIFVLTEEFMLPPGHPAAIEPFDPRWVEILNRLAGNDIIYDNEHIEIYSTSE